MNALELRLVELGSRWTVERSYDMTAEMFQAIADRLPPDRRVTPLLPSVVQLRRDCMGGHVHASLTTWMGSERQLLFVWRCGSREGVKAAVVLEALHDLVSPESVEHTELVVREGSGRHGVEIQLGGPR